MDATVHTLVEFVLWSRQVCDPGVCFPIEPDVSCLEPRTTTRTRGRLIRVRCCETPAEPRPNALNTTHNIYIYISVLDKVYVYIQRDEPRCDTTDFGLLREGSEALNHGGQLRSPSVPYRRR